MCEDCPACGIYGIDIAFFSKLDIAEHDRNFSSGKRLFQNLGTHANLHKPFGISPCHADILHDNSLGYIDLRLLYDFYGGIIHNHHECVGLRTAFHVKSDIGINRAAGDNSLLVNHVQLIDHKPVLDFAQPGGIGCDGLVRGKNVSKSPCLCKVVLA